MSSAFRRLSPVDITPGTTGSYQEVDLTAYVSTDCVGVWVLAENTGVTVSFGVRKNGSTTDLYTLTAQGRTCQVYVGIDASDIIEIKVLNSDTTITLIGEICDPAVMFTNPEDVSTGTTGSYVEVDVSTEAPDASLLLLSVIGGTSTRMAFFRKEGSTDDRYSNVKYVYVRGNLTGVDASQVFEQKIEGTTVDLYVEGYYPGTNVTMNTNAIDRSLTTTAAWTDLTALPAGALTGFYEMQGGFSGLRKNGESDEHYGQCASWRGWIVECDGSQLVEGKIDTTAADFWERGYAEDEATVPVVTTQAATILVPGGATLNGNITDDGGASISEHGFVWKAGSDPVNIAGGDGFSELGAGAEGAYDQAKTGLTEDTLYYYRAYATNVTGDGYGSAQTFTTGEVLSGVVAMTPGASMSVSGNIIADGVFAMTPAMAMTALGGQFQNGIVAITPEMVMTALGETSTEAVCAISIALDLASDTTIIRGGTVAMSLAVDLAVAANYLTNGVVEITPDMIMTASGGSTTLASAAITPDMNLSAIPIRIIQAGTVAITVDMNMVAAAVRSIVVAISLSGDLGAGSVWEIDSEKQTFKIDGVNVLKDMVGDFFNIPPGESAVEYSDDEVARDTDINIRYTPRDA